MTKNRPRIADPGIFQSLNDLTEEGSYVRIDDATTLSQSLQGYAAGRFKSMVIAASGYLPGPGDHGELTPSGTIFLLRNFRYCEHDRQPHFNADDTVFWTDGQERRWQASSKDAPDHYQLVVSGTAVVDVWNTFRFPNANRGSLDDFRTEGAYLDFRGPCPGFKEDKKNQTDERSE